MALYDEPDALIRARLKVQGAATALELTVLAGAGHLLAIIDGAADAVADETGMNRRFAHKALLEEIPEGSALRAAVRVYQHKMRQQDEGPDEPTGPFGPYSGPNGNGPSDN